MRAGPEIAVTTFGGDEVPGKSRVEELERVYYWLDNLAEELAELKFFVAGLVVEDDGGPDLEEILFRPCGFCLKIMQGGRP